MADESGLHDDVWAMPVMSTITDGLIVQPIEQALVPARVGRFGAISVGAGHIDGAGGALHISIHDRDGHTLLASLGRGAISQLALQFNAACDALDRGDFDKPETRQ